MSINEQLTCLSLPVEQLTIIANNFCRQMEQALAGEVTSLKMLSAYLPPASGLEQGLFLTVDFGGTNVRVLEIQLIGKHILQVNRKRSFPLKTKFYDYTAKNCTGEMLFGYIASEIADFVGASDHEYLLGHTFSFPFTQAQANQARLINWTKEFQTSGVVGIDVTLLLSAALRRQGLVNVTPIAVINDTVATLLTASYQQDRTTIGAICGTGHNSCYVEENCGQSVIINLESGNFSGIPLTPWDVVLDRTSELPGQQLLEKQVAGAYLGQLVAIIFEKLRLVAADQSEADRFSMPGIYLQGEDLANILVTADPLSITELMLLDHGLTLSAADCQLLKTIVAAVVERSARLVAATFSGILQHVDPSLQQLHRIAMDGSLYEKMPGYAKQLQQALIEIHGIKAKNIQMSLVKDGSGIGAAIAAALCKPI